MDFAAAQKQFLSGGEEAAETQIQTAQDRVKKYSGTSGDQFVAGFDEASTITGNLLDYASAQTGSGKPTFSAQEGFGWKSSEELYGADAELLSPDQRRGMAAQDRINDMNRWYLDIDTDTMMGGLGNLVGSTASPESFIPLGRGVAGAIKGGALLGGAYGASEGLAKEGEIDPINVGVTAALGAVMGGAIEGAIVQPIANLVRNSRARGVDISPDDIAEALSGQLLLPPPTTGQMPGVPGAPVGPRSGGGLPSPSAVADILNLEFGLKGDLVDGELAPFQQRMGIESAPIEGEFTVDAPMNKLEMEHNRLMGDATLYLRGTPRLPGPDATGARLTPTQPFMPPSGAVEAYKARFSDLDDWTMSNIYGNREFEIQRLEQIIEESPELVSKIADEIINTIDCRY